MIGNEITLNTVQGLGDIFWIYQKFSPYFNKINFNILVIDTQCPVQLRAKDFMGLLPKVGIVNFQLVEPGVYHKVAGSRYYLQDIIDEYKNGKLAFDYACNKPLEDGINISDIDGGFTLERTVEIKYNACDLPYEKYVVLYVSYEPKWSARKWGQFLKFFHDKVKLPILIIGAMYDAKMSFQVSDELKSRNIEHITYIDRPIDSICYIIKNAFFFIGYQSGLNVIADNFDVPQLMLYFKNLEKMTYTWPKPININNKVFQADYFTSSPQNVFNKLYLKM